MALSILGAARDPKTQKIFVTMLILNLFLVFARRAIPKVNKSVKATSSEPPASPSTGEQGVVPSQLSPSSSTEEQGVAPSQLLLSPSPSTGEAVASSQPTPSLPTPLPPVLDELIDPALRELLASHQSQPAPSPSPLSQPIPSPAEPIDPAVSPGPETTGSPTPPIPLSTPFSDSESPTGSQSNPMPSPERPPGLFLGPEEWNAHYMHMLGILSPNCAAGEQDTSDGVTNKLFELNKTISKRKRSQPKKQITQVSQGEVSGVGKENIPPLGVGVIQPLQTPNVVTGGWSSRECAQKLLGGPETIDERNQRGRL
ncbi:hypothetical protein BT96DRAFT_1010815 [Gymnopus androsaceus JB14]|uniref:Uncharacterized protein n=1 Tax=Gymnopus androsaceus JB14 TaxID=1447944 RepID=A0A6A4GA62_9AGAR|nr:hypothetical protein BT96DRAFT_1010815 [Gymnopus androsaceus JB14]